MDKDGVLNEDIKKVLGILHKKYLLSFNSEDSNVIGGDGGNRTRVQGEILNTSTCLLYSLGLNIYPREYTKKINTELKIVRLYIKQL